jgi:hypothetical protein
VLDEYAMCTPLRRYFIELLLRESAVTHRKYREEVGAPVATKSVPAGNVALIKAIMAGIAPFIHELEKKIDALQARVAELERSQKTYLGVWKDGREYSPHSEVTHDGGRWFCHKRTSNKPGSSADWALMEKSVNPRSDATTANSRVNGHHPNPRRP